MVGSLGTVLLDAARNAREHDAPTRAQALAYALFLSIPSALLVALGVFSLVADADDLGTLVDRMESVMPAEAAELIRQSLERSIASTGSGIVMTVAGLVLALWSTTSAATSLMEGVTLAFGHRDRRAFVRKRLIALVIVLSLTFAALVLLGLLVFGPHFSRWIGDATGNPGLTEWLWWTAQWPILLVTLLIVFAVVLFLGPDVDERRWQVATPGAVVALVVWLVASGALAVYSSRFGSYEKTWGTLSAVVVTLLWLWLGSAALLFGAEINAQAQRLTRDEEAVSAMPATGRPVEG